MNRLGRRNLLRFAGWGAAASVLPAAFLQSMTRAQNSPLNPNPNHPVRRLILISHCHGWPYEAWKIRPEGLSELHPWSIDLKTLNQSQFSRTLSPLFPHRHRLFALDGLSLASAELDSDGNRHDTGWIHAWTGNQAEFSGVDTRSTSASLDQLVAQHIASPGQLPSLEFMVQDSNEAGRPIAYSKTGARLPVEASPIRAWERIFGPAVTGNPLGKRHRATSDFAHAEYQALAPKLDAEARPKLDSHFDLLQSLGTRIDGLANLASACPLPATPRPVLGTYDERFDAFAQLIAAAFSCDASRVVSFSLGEMPTSDFGADHITDDVHKGLAHQIYDDPQKFDAMANYLTRHAEQISRLVSILESTPDIQGGSLMDHTLIVWGSELADGWHGYRHYCPILIGGSWHWPHKLGQYHYWPHQSPVEILVPPSTSPSSYTPVSGLPHQHLLISAAQAMGLAIDHVGLEYIRGQRGDFIPCRGPIVGT